jgi:hypothetical protein
MVHRWKASFAKTLQYYSKISVTYPDENCFQFNKMKTPNVFVREEKCSSTTDQYDFFLVGGGGEKGFLCIKS